MAILYDVSRNADQDETQWTGAQEHDHAHITMVIGQELWGPPFSNQERDAPIQRNPKIRQKDLLPHVERLQTDLAPATADILQRMALRGFGLRGSENPSLLQPADGIHSHGLVWIGCQ
jgi:hypothetical protein